MRRYETFVIMDPELSQDQRDQVIQRIEELITQMDGFLVFTDSWGERKLAYNIKNRARGYYVRFDYCGLSPLVNEIERFSRIDDRALKYMTVLLDNAADLEKIKEEQAEAESRAKIKEAPQEASQEVQPAPVEAAPEVQSAPVEAAPEVQPAQVEAAPEVQPTPVEADREVQPAPVEADREVQPAPVEADRETEAVPQEAAGEVKPAPLEDTAPVEKNTQEDVAPTSDASDSAADTTPLKNPEEA